MPRLFQWLRDRPRAYQQPSKPSYVEHGTRFDVEAGARWDGSGSTAAIFTNHYIRLEERVRTDGQDPDSQLQRDRPDGTGPAALTYPFDPRVQDK